MEERLWVSCFNWTSGSVRVNSDERDLSGGATECLRRQDAAAERLIGSMVARLNGQISQVSMPLAEHHLPISRMAVSDSLESCFTGPQTV